MSGERDNPASTGGSPGGVDSRATSGEARSFFVTGGTLRADARCYVERRADLDLFDGLRQADFCYVLTSRQMGKSSLMVRASRRLRELGATVITLDLTAFGQNLTPEQWYDGLALRIGRQLRLEDEMEAFWNEHRQLGPCQRLFTALHDLVLPVVAGATPGGSRAEAGECAAGLVVFADELDVVRSLPFSTDEFFAAIRECYNRRTEEPVFERLTFCLLGVATPGDLIHDTRITPFNIGRRIELNDFTRTEAAQLETGLVAGLRAAGVGAPGLGAETFARDALDRVYHWTQGHPYLTQRLCQALLEGLERGGLPEAADSAPPLPAHPKRAVDQVCEGLFFSHRARERDDNLIFVRERLLRTEEDLASLLDMYSRVLRGWRVADDEMSAVCGALRLSGVVRVRAGRFEVRNRIYRRVFDRNWIERNMPAAELRRQKGAFRRGVRRGLIIVGLLVMINTAANVAVQNFLPERRDAQVTSRVGDVYREARSYRDEFEAELDADYLTLRALRGISGALNWRQPDTVRMMLTAGANPRLEIMIAADSNQVHNTVPAVSRFILSGRREAPNFLAPDLSRALGVVAIQPFARMFLPGGDLAVPALGSKGLQRVGREDLNGIPVVVIAWHADAAALFKPLGIAMQGAERRGPVPVKAWVERDRGLVRQIELDLTRWGDLLIESAPDLTLHKLVLRERRRRIRLDAPFPGDFFDPPRVDQLTRVERFQLSQSEGLVPELARQQLERMIPSRLPGTPPGLLDLSAHYNASLQARWHPGPEGNDLAGLPPGILLMDGIPFDVRGLIQLTGRQIEASGARFPKRAEGIPVGRAFAAIHCLHATAWWTETGKEVARLILRYADGESAEVPIVYGRDTADWHSSRARGAVPMRATVAWQGRNAAGGNIRLYHSVLANPRPEAVVERIDLVSRITDAAPFVVALTVEPWVDPAAQAE